MKKIREKKRGFSLAALFRRSLILQMLDRFSDKIYRSFGAGFFGWLFTGYQAEEPSLLESWFSESILGKFVYKIRYFVNRQIEESLGLLLIRSWMLRLLRCKMRVFGIYLLTFGTYTAVFNLIGGLSTGTNVVDGTEFMFSLLMIGCAVPVFLSRSTLRDNLCETYSGRFLLRILGATPEHVWIVGQGTPTGRMNIAFLAGIICGVMTYWLRPWWILSMLAVCLVAYLILGKPEIGVMFLFFFMPFLPTMLLAALLIYVFLCTALKILRGKRLLHVEPLDIMVFAFACILFFGGIVSLSGASLKPALLLTCFLFGYFEVVRLLRDRTWLNRCMMAGVLSATLVSLYGVFQYFAGNISMAAAWVDSEMFTAIGARAVATLENPNMLGEYLILMLPLAVIMLVGHGEGFRRTSALVCIAVMGLCLLLTWSRGAWIGIIFAAILFVFMWHKRAIWLLFAGVASIPLLPMVLPASIISRFTSIGNMSDSSTSYRVYIWRSTVSMLEDFGLTGIGIGEGAWDRVYPLYAFMGVEAAPHSHNLFLQIWLETGIFGLMVFLLVLFLLAQSVFTVCRQVTEAKKLSLPKLRCSEVESQSAQAFNQLHRKAKIQLRLTTIAPFAAICGVLMQGLTDYTWYNYRVYLMFWLVLGLASACVRSARSMLIQDVEDGEAEEASLELPYRPWRKK